MWSILLSAWDISPLLSFQAGWSSRHWEQDNRWILLLSSVNIPHQEDEDWGQVSDRSHDILGSTRLPGSGLARPRPIRGQPLVSWPGQPIRGQSDNSSVTWADWPGLSSLATMWGNVQTFSQYLDFCADLVDWNRKQKTLRNKYKNREYWFQTDRPSTLRWCKGWKNVSKFSSYRFLLIWNHENCWAAVEFRDPILWSTFPIRERILAGWKVFSSGTKTITILSKIIEGVLTMKTLAWRPDCWDDFISINFSPMIG